MDYFLRANGFSETCTAKRTPVPQLDGVVQHIAKVRKLFDELDLRKDLSDVHPVCLKTKTLRKLMRSPGACDILQAIVRRSLMPNRTQLVCRRCDELATIHHVLIHPHDDEECHAGDYFNGETPSIRELVRNFACADKQAFKYVCRRLVLYLEDSLANKWATRLLGLIDQ